jgi:ribA/ribD-fused uncharacterized protein
MMGDMWTRESLAEHLAGGGQVEFQFFWGHTPRREGKLDSACLSQWFPCAFELEGTRYISAEHFMMAEKARLFGDETALAAVLAASTPSEAKALGRAVRGYDDVAWGRARVEAVVRGNVAKFGQDPELRKFLQVTSPRILVEASPRDRIWGIGMGSGNPDARNPAAWRGQNLLGFALVEARERLGRA